MKDARTGEEVILYPSSGLTADLAEVNQKFLCSHHSSHELRQGHDSAGNVIYRRQCLQCGARFGNAVAHSEAPNDAPIFDDSLESAFASLRKKEIYAVYQKHIDLQKRRETDRQREYDEYLKTPAWRARRDKVLARADWRCEGCGVERATQAHHLTYQNFRAEFLFELVAVCAPCHTRLHSKAEITQTFMPFDEGIEREGWEPPCCDCRYGCGDSLDCGKFNIPVRHAMADGGPCGPGRTEFEPLK